MALSLAQWHARYQQQARWTKSLRTYLYDKASLSHATQILDVGCGAGVLEKELSDALTGEIYGLDIDVAVINLASTYAPTAFYIAGNGVYLPFKKSAFDVSFCHFFLLWVEHAGQAVKEMARVTRSGGFVIAMAEPDYGGRIDYPQELASIGRWQSEALEQQGADPLAGRKLRSLFSAAGLQDVEVGILGAQWTQETSENDIDLEWQVLVSDLSDNPDFMQQINEIKNLEQNTRQDQSRILFVPVFYAIGKVAR
jgi:ubiquinone/menaquinone biosynthesis C-methylase UbiE